MPTPEGYITYEEASNPSRIPPLMWQDRDFRERPVNPWYSYNSYEYGPFGSMVDNLKRANDFQTLGAMANLDPMYFDRVAKEIPNFNQQYGNEPHIYQMRNEEDANRASGVYTKASNSMAFPPGEVPYPSTFQHESAHSFSQQQSPEWWNQFRDAVAYENNRNTPVGEFISDLNPMNMYSPVGIMERMYAGNPNELAAFLPHKFANTWGDVNPQLQELYSGFMQPRNNPPQMPYNAEAYDSLVLAPQQYANYLNQPGMGHGPAGVPWYVWEGNQ